jgi:hypothetical protein
MSNTKIIHAVEIKLDVVLSDDASLGIYTISGVSYLKWSEYPIIEAGYSWASGIIADGGLSAEEAGADLRRGGAPVAYTGYTINVQSTYQNYLKLKSLGVNLVGRKIKRWDFIGSDTNSRVTSKMLMSTLIIQDSSWNDAEWKIQVMNATYTQNAFMGTIINNDPDSGNYKDATDDLNGKMVPLTFGAFKVIDGNPVPAKFIRTANKQTAIVNSDLLPNILPSDQSIFPITQAGTTPTLEYLIKLGLTDTSTDLQFTAMIASLNAMLTTNELWLKIVEGGSVDNTSLVGKFKKIASFEGGTNSTHEIIILTSDYFEKDLSGNSTATATNQVWCSIVNLKYGFSGDIWKLKGFLETDGSLLSSGIRLYSFINKDIQKSFERTIIYDAAQNQLGYSKLKKVGFRPVGLYGYSVFNDGNNNALIINAMLCDDDPDKLYSFDIFPLGSLQKYLAADLSAYGQNTFVPLQLGGQNTNVYIVTPAYASLLSYVESGSAGNAFDADDNTSDQHVVAVQVIPGVQLGFFTAFEIGIDFSKISIDYDNYYLGLNIHTATDHTYSATGIVVASRRFMGPYKYILLSAYAYKYLDTSVGGDINNLPDFYYKNRIAPDNNFSFVRIPDWTQGQSTIREFSGYKTFPLDKVNSLDLLQSIYKIGLLIETISINSGVNVTYTHTLNFKELAIICQSTDNISSEIFTLCSGRIFNDAWGARKTATNQMVTPADIIEHCKRLGNFGTPSVTPGLEYDAAALIKTGSAEGSFDMISMMPSTITTYPGFYKPTFQVDNDSEAWTAEIEKKLCATYGLCTYYDPDGTACIKSLLPESPAETINFEDLAGECSDVQPAQVQDVFCQPLLNYQYNYGSSKFDKQLAITNIQADTYDPSYAMGFSGSDGEAVWNTCRALYLKYKQIEVPPSDWTDQKTVSTYGEALALIKMKLAWMNKYRITVPVFYDKGKTYHYAQHINLALPHQTNGEVYECVIEKVIKDKNFNPAGKVEVSLVFIDDLDSISFFF